MSEQTEMRIKMKTLVLAEKLLWEGTLAGCFTVPRRETVFWKERIISLPGDWDIW